MFTVIYLVISSPGRLAGFAESDIDFFGLFADAGLCLMEETRESCFYGLSRPRLSAAFCVFVCLSPAPPSHSHYASCLLVHLRPFTTVFMLAY